MARISSGTKLRKVMTDWRDANPLVPDDDQDESWDDTMGKKFFIFVDMLGVSDNSDRQYEVDEQTWTAQKSHASHGQPVEFKTVAGRQVILNTALIPALIFFSE